MNSIIEAEKFEPETTFENTINEIKDVNLKIINSLHMNLSAITPNKPSLSYEHSIANCMPWIVLQSPGKSPQFTKYFSSMHPKGNNQLKIRKWLVTLR